MKKVVRMYDLYNPNQTWKQRGPAISQSERYALELIGVEHIGVTEGYCPEYDAVDLDTEKTYEVKFSTKCKTVGRCYYPVYVEYKHPDGKPSALMLSEADYYLIVSPGYSSKHEKRVGKVRQFKRTDLLDALKGNGDSLITADGQFAVIDHFRLAHKWFGDVRCINEGGRIIGYDMSKFLY